MVNYNAVIIVVSALMALIAVDCVYFKILKISKLKGLVDNPDARKLQKTPIPVMGGIAVFLGFVAGIMTASILLRISHEISFMIDFIPVLLGMMAMLYTGSIDDIVGLSPKSRLVIEVLVMLGLIYGSGSCIDSFHGTFGVNGFSWWIAVPLTVFAGIGIINAVNMIDGVNGLSSGLCIVVSSMFGFFFWTKGDIGNALLAFIMMSSLLPFYVHNVFGNRSRMFIGDGGTLVMGILLVWFTISVLNNNQVIDSSDVSNFGLIAMVLAFLCVPVFDTLRVMTMRMIHGVSPFNADKTHLHHVLIAAGVSHFITSITIVFINIFIVVMWWMSVKFGLNETEQLFVVICLSMFLVWGVYAIIHYQESHHTDFMHWLSHFSVSTHLGRKSWWISISTWLDAREGYDIDKENAEFMENLKLKFNNSDDYKQIDCMKVIEYLKGKSEVHVQDIIKYSGADSLRVYPIIFELEHNSIIEILKRKGLGTPDIVMLSPL